MGQTIAEKIISQHAGHAVYAGDIAIVRVDGVMATDATGPFALKAFEEMGGTTVWDPARVTLILDHAAPAPNERIANLHKLLRDFAAEQGCHFYDVGEGICHQLIVENGHVKPGELFLGADSHTPTYGALNALSMGVGSTDLAGTLLTGKTWLKVPRSIKIVLNGTLKPGISAKDLILMIVGRVGIAGGTYMSIEFTGEAIVPMTLASRMVLANMVAEMGAKCAIVDPTGLDLSGLDVTYDWTPTFADADAEYAAVYEFDVSELVPMVAVPHSPDNVVPLHEVAGTRIHQAFIGSCTNSRLEDLHAAAEVLKGKRIAAGVRLLITPASKAVFSAALKDGTVEILTDAGAVFMTSGCGPCVGTHMGIPGNDEAIISSTNRNFKGRMGNPNANIYLSSPAVVAASALRGEITDPAEILAAEAQS